MTFKTSFKETVSLFLTHLILVSFLPFFPLTVHADDWERTSDYIVSFEAGLVQNAGNAVISYYTSVDPATLEICEQALAFGECVVLDSLEQAEREGALSTSGTSQISVGQCVWTDSDGVTHNAIGSVKCNTYSISFMCSACGAYALDAFTTYTNLAYTAANVQSIRIRYQILMGKYWEGYAYTSSYFDSSGSSDSYGSDYKNFDIPVKRSSGPTALTPTSFSVTSFGLSSNGSEYVAVKSGQTPIEVTPDYSSPEALYQSSQDYYNGLLEKYDKDLVDQFWYDLPDPAQEDTTVPDGSGCCCQLFTLPSEWVQSDVVELETDHYTVPYDDMIEEPFDYLAGLGTYPNPPTPALNARKRSETSTATRAVSVDEGSPPLIWDLADYETKTALTDYFLFAENLLHDTGLYNLVGSLIAVGIIVSLV